MSVKDSASMPEGHSAPELPTNRLSYRLDMAILVFGRAISWLWLATMAVVLTNVVNRFILGRGSIAVEELSWHLFGATMILTLAYAVVSDDHVRVDVIREKLTLRTQAWIELVGIVLLALPILYLMTEALFEYGYRAYQRDEHSQAPSGLPHRFIIKTLIPIGMSLVAVALFSRALRCSTLLFGYPLRIRRTTPRQ